MRLCTLIFPLPQGTTTLVLPKHTVTFIVPDIPSDSNESVRSVATLGYDFSSVVFGDTKTVSKIHEM